MAIDMRIGFVLFAFGLVAPSVRGDEIRDAADQIIARSRANDHEALRAIAASKASDAWRIVDELCFLAAHDAAAAFAAMLSRGDGEAIVRYVTVGRGRDERAADRETLRRANEAREAGRPAEALKALAPLRTDDGSILSVRLLSARSLALEQLNRPKEASAAFEAAATEAERLGWLQQAIATYTRAAMRALEVGDLAGGVRLGHHALRNADARGDGEARIMALVMLASAEAGRDRVAQALTYGEMARQAAQGPDHEDSRRTAQALLRLIRSRIDPETALHEHEAALTAAERGGDSRGVAMALEGKAGAYAALGRHAERTACLERLLGVVTTLRAPAWSADVRRRLGRTYLAQGLPLMAVPHLEEALMLLRSLEDEEGEADALLNLVDAFTEIKDTSKALDHAEQCERICERLADRDRLSACLALKGLAFRKAGTPEKALPVVERALAIAEEIGLPQNTLLVLAVLGAVQSALRDEEGALKTYRRLVRERLSTTRGLGDEEAVLARERAEPELARAATLAVLADAPEDLCYFIEAGRAQALLEMIEAKRDVAATRVPPELLDAEARARRNLAETRQRLVAADRARDADATRRIREELDRAGAELGGALDQIGRRAKIAADLLYPEPAPLVAIRESLGPEEAMVLYAPSTPPAALVVTRRDVRIAPLGELADVEEACARLGIAPGGAARGIDLEKTTDGRLSQARSDPSEALRRIGKLVVEPLELDGRVRRVLVSPHGLLAYVPMCLLLGDREVVYLPSATTALRLRELGAGGGRGVLALGDPAYAEAQRLARLPGARKEVESIGDVRLLGAEATEAGFRRALAERPRWRSLHFACHGIANPEAPRFSALAVAAADGDDGQLSVNEILRMDLPADLVVLSACETGRGRVYHAEGVVGFSRAFMFAGAPQVIVSLWKVDDEATCALMAKFYELWNPDVGSQRIPAGAALRKAQEHIRTQPQWRHPYYWAAWQLWGNAG